MSTLTRNCPHCAARPAMFNIYRSDKVTLPATKDRLTRRMSYGDNRHVYACYAICIACQGPISFFCISPVHEGKIPTDFHGEIEGHNFSIPEFWPTPRQAEIPRHLPDELAQKLSEAERSFSGKIFTGAAGLYRSLIDSTTKRQLGDAALKTKDSLAARIDRLADNHVIPKIVADWAHEVRVVANDGLHEDALVNEEDATMARSFALTYLRYAFELPGDVQSRRAPKATTTPGTPQ